MTIKTICLASLFAVAMPLAAFAADLGAEVTAAQTHAGLAGKAGTIDMVHTHLHHALNCLVGPSGDGYDASQMNPCAKSGGGLIPDSTSAAQKAGFEKAVMSAKAGIAATDLAAAQKDASDTATTIASAK